MVLDGFAPLDQFVEEFFLIDEGLVVDMLELEVLDFHDAVDLFLQVFVVIEFADLEADLRDFVGEERCDAGMGRAERVFAEALFLVAVKVDMIGHDDVGTLGHEDLRFRDTGCLDLFDFLDELLDIERHAVADDVDGVRVADTARKGVQRETTVIVDDGVAGVGTALETDDDVGLGGEHVGDLTFSFVAPVTAYDCFYHGDEHLQVL